MVLMRTHLRLFDLAGHSRGTAEKAIQEEDHLHLRRGHPHLRQSLHEAWFLFHQGRLQLYACDPTSSQSNGPVGLHNSQVADRYRNVTKGSLGNLPPHIFAVAGAAFQEMFRERRDQVRAQRLHDLLCPVRLRSSLSIRRHLSVSVPFSVAWFLERVGPERPKLLTSSSSSSCDWEGFVMWCV